MQHIYGMKKQQAVFVLCETKGKMNFCPEFWRVLKNLLLKINSILSSSVEILFVYCFEIRRRTREYKMITTLALLENHLWCWRKYRKTFNVNKIIKQTKMYLAGLKKTEVFFSSLIDTCEGERIMIWSYLQPKTGL